MSEREDYYNILEKTQKGSGDVTEWLVWFLGCFSRAIQHSDDLLNGRFLEGRVLAETCPGQADGATEEGYQPIVGCRPGRVRGWIDHAEIRVNDTL